MTDMKPSGARDTGPDTGLDAGPDRYPHLHGDFRWSVPTEFNIAEVCSRRWARQTPQAVAIFPTLSPQARVCCAKARKCSLVSSLLAA